MYNVHLLAYTFLLTSLYFACPKIQKLVHYTNITEVIKTRPNYLYFMTKEVRHKYQFDSFN